MPSVFIQEADEDLVYDLYRQRLDDEMDLSEVQYNDELHEYRIDGAVVPSVTEIIKPIQTEGGSESVRDYKRQIGKALDTAITLNEQDDLDVESLDDAVLPFFEAWLKFKAESGFRVLLNQPKVHSRKLRFAGTPDLIGTRNPGTATPDELLDTKCVWTMDPATAIQTAGYSIALLESHGIRIKKRGGVQLLRDGTYKFYPYNDPLDEQVFKCLLSIFSWKRLHR